MANFRNFLMRKEITDDQHGDFIKDVQDWIYNKERRSKPFNSFDKYEHFPSDWEHGYELYEAWLKRNGACFTAIEIGQELWEEFVKEHNVVPTK